MDNKYFYNLLSEQTKKLLRDSFVQFGRVKNGYIDIDDKDIEYIFAKAITANEKDIFITYEGDNHSSFDALATYEKETIGISLKTIKNINLNAKIYEMSSLKNEISTSTPKDEVISKIVSLFNDRLNYEKEAFHINNFQILYFEKHKDKVVILCDYIGEIDRLSIENIEKTDSRISFIANNERYTYTFSNNTLMVTRCNATLLDTYLYSQDEICDRNIEISNFINKNTKKKENGMDAARLEKFKNASEVYTGEELLEILKDSELRKLKRMIRVNMDNETFGKIRNYHTTTNRDIRNRKVEEYRKAMVAGDWNDNIGNDLVFDSDGNLIDGNHRVLAGANIDKPIRIPMWVNIGGERSSAIDTGTKRNLDDKVKYLEYVPEEVRDLYSKHWAGMLAFYCHFFNGTDKQNTDKGQADLAKEFFKNFSKPFSEVATSWTFEGKEINITTCKYTRMAPVLLAIFNNYLNKNISIGDIRHIVEVLYTGLSSGQRDAQLIGLKEEIDKKGKNKKTNGTGDSWTSYVFRTADTAIKNYKNGVRNKKIDPPKAFSDDIIRLGGDKTTHTKEYEE